MDPPAWEVVRDMGWCTLGGVGVPADCGSLISPHLHKDPSMFLLGPGRFHLALC